jgi:hypothetical protein
MLNMNRGLAAAIAAALLSLPLMPAAQARDGALPRNDNYGRSAKTKNQPEPSRTTWSEGNTDYHGSNGS